VKPVFVIGIFAILCSLDAVAQGQGQPATPAAPSAQTAPQGAQPNPVAEKLSPEALAGKYAEIWNTGNFDLTSSILSVQAFITSRGQRARLEPGTLRRVVTAWRKSMPDLNFKIEDTIVQGEKVVMRVVFTGSYKERLFANTADPKDHPRSIRASAIWIFDTRDGKIRQIWEEYDEIRLHYQMGGFWRSNEELEAAAKAAAKAAPPAAEPAPEPTPSPAPPPKP
jgi:predicted ester cyclase